MKPSKLKKGHSSRLKEIRLQDPIIFVTTCTHDRRQVLACEDLQEICLEVWHNAEKLYGWVVGRYVLMPDHVHFFCGNVQDEHSLSTFVGKWKEWTAKYSHRRHDLVPPLWQTEFFDHLLRSSESYDQKWQYVLENPVRAGLVRQVNDWPYQGEIHKLLF